jgi:hypothetical protein
MANTTGKKFGGRQKGGVNKTTASIRESFQLLLENNLEGLQNDIDSLDPHQRIQMILQLAKFVVPTLRNVEVESETNVLNLGMGIKPIEVTIIQSDEAKRIDAYLESKY